MGIESIMTGLTLDSRCVQPGDIFVALKGHRTDGRNYIHEAIQNGAIAILVEAGSLNSTQKNYSNDETVPAIEYPRLTDALGFIASRFFLEPSKTMPVIGITGTSGKTSCAHFIAQLLNAWHKPCGFIGTLGVGWLSDLQGMNTTTPDAISIHRYLADLRAKGAFAVVMEVSSHALVQKRVNGVRFSTAIFTHFSQDHLDYHGNMAVYWHAKTLLFTEQTIEHAVINVDDVKAIELIKLLVQAQKISKDKIIGYSINPALDKRSLAGIRLIEASAVQVDQFGVAAYVHTPWGEGQLYCSLLGPFNLSNILAALGAVCIQGMPFSLALELISLLKTVPGRMMCLGGGKKPRVIVDYAHKPDALKQVLTTLRSFCCAKLWCVFGCGGERDREKRPLMASIAEALSDYVIMTGDNPRMEEEAQIFEDMLRGIKKPKEIIIEPNRVKAIQQAITHAGPLDIVLIAGKGHETVQITGKMKIPLDDYQEAFKVLKGWTA